MNTIQELIINKNNIKSPHLIFPSLILGITGGVFIFLGVKSDDLTSILVGLSLFLFVLILIIIGLTTKIKINWEGISYVSIFKKIHINWEEINTIGAFRINRYQISKINHQKLGSFSFLGQTFLYISIKPNYFPTKQEETNQSYFCFHYNKDAWELINLYMIERKEKFAII